MKYQRPFAILMTLTVLLAACVPARVPQAASSVKGAFETGQYPNLFKDLLGKTDAEIQTRLDEVWQQLFYGSDDSQRVYFPVAPDMGYVKDINNNDIRSEGMSYGMMIAVQTDHQEEFNRIWKWAKTYMYQTDGPYKGYFAWHNRDDGSKIEDNPASDGEEWFVMALMFASGRWGDGEGIYNYRGEAQAILDTMLHKEDADGSSIATNMFGKNQKQVVFVPYQGLNSFTDPSYHLPAYYELWSRWAAQDQDFWKSAAQTSRAFFKKTAHPQTGLVPDYANFNGTPYGTDDHKDFRYDAWRTAQNIAVDYSWFAADPWQVEQSNRWLDFFTKQGIGSYGNQFSVDGKKLSGDHSTGLVAMNAVAALASTNPNRKDFVEALWDTQTPAGKYRYYDGLLYFIGLLHDSGNFRIYAPK